MPEQKESILNKYIASEKITQVKQFSSIIKANDFMCDVEVINFEIKRNPRQSTFLYFVIYKTNFMGYPKE